MPCFAKYFHRFSMKLVLSKFNLTLHRKQRHNFKEQYTLYQCVNCFVQKEICHYLD